MTVVTIDAAAEGRGSLGPDGRTSRWRAGPIAAYATLFAVVLPSLLVAWMLRLDRLFALPAVGTERAAVVLLAGGAALGAWGILSLWRFGGGLPMSPFPPPRFATRGAYRLVADPIYVGAALVCAGTAMALGSPAGVWIVTPLFAVSMAAFVAGYERHATTSRFGSAPRPFLHLPADSCDPPRIADRLSVYVLVMGPWLVAYEAVELLGVPRDAVSTYLPFETRWPVIPWTEAVYFAAYILVVLAPLVAPSRRELRRFAHDGLAATVAIIPFYLLVPLVAQAKPVPPGSAWALVLAWERAGNAPVTALPAFHVVWPCIAACVFARRWPRARWAIALLTAAVAASCVTTGMHAALDVLAGVAVWGLVRLRGRIWKALCRWTEAIANSWRERTVGGVRLLSHGAYAAAGAAFGVALATALAGAGLGWWVIGLALVAEAGAAVWAQVVEGSSQLLRPFGYFGSVIAVLAAAPVAWASGADPWLLLAAFAAGACVAQVFGRIRCLIQGCCHGRPTDTPWGIRYRHARSRVLRLSPFGGVPLHPTPLYSMIASVATGALLVRLWTLAAPLPFIAGCYLVAMGLTRFVEEHYRGEPQTAWICGLRLYQWLAIGFVVVGAGLTAVGGAPAPTPSAVPIRFWPWIALLGVLSYTAYGVDFPRSGRRFSRLV